MPDADTRPRPIAILRAPASSGPPAAVDAETHRRAGCRCDRRELAAGYLGHVTCAGCGALYTTHDPTLPSHAGAWCGCGARLWPGLRLLGRVWTHRDYSARVCCLECVLARLQSAAGLVAG